MSTGTRQLPEIGASRAGAQTWVRDELGHLCCDEPTASPAFVGGQRAADAALAELDIAGYARRRSMVAPESARGASKLSPYIRHGLLQLRQVWDATDSAPNYDRFRYQGELLWQEHARHWYALAGRSTAVGVAYEQPAGQHDWDQDPWWRQMNCIDSTLRELHTDGWCVNQTRMWLAGQYTLRGKGQWQDGEDEMFRHLLDGSRAANRMGWQWSAGTSRSRAYNFSRRQVQKRADQFCQQCELRNECPIKGWAKAEPRSRVTAPQLADPQAAFGPEDVLRNGEPEVVWLTAESLGSNDPALSAHPGLPVLFVFDEPLLQRLQLSGKRLIFLAETLAEIAEDRDVSLYLGDPRAVLDGRRVAATFAPVPGFAPRVDAAESVTLHPWPWLRPRTPGLQRYVTEKGRMPSFKDWCQVTKPGAQ